MISVTPEGVEPSTCGLEEHAVAWPAHDIATQIVEAGD
jgi:hypothetical protein